MISDKTLGMSMPYCNLQPREILSVGSCENFLQVIIHEINVVKEKENCKTCISEI